MSLFSRRSKEAPSRSAAPIRASSGARREAPSGALGPQHVIALQRTIGNAAVQHALANRGPTTRRRAGAVSGIRSAPSTLAAIDARVSEIRHAVAAAVAAVVAASVHGTGRRTTGASDRDQLDKAMAYAQALAVSLERDVRTGRGLVARSTDEHDLLGAQAKLLAGEGSLSDPKAASAMATKLAEVYFTTALTEEATAVAERKLAVLAPDIEHLHDELEKAVEHAHSEAEVDQQLTPTTSALTERFTKVAVKAIGQKQQRPVREEILAEGLRGATGALERTVMAESGPKAALSGLSKSVITKSLGASLHSDALEVVEEAYQALRAAVATAVAAEITKRIEGGWFSRGSKRAAVLEARAEAARLADTLAFALERDFRTGTGALGSYRATGDDATDRVGSATHTRNRAGLLSKERRNAPETLVAQLAKAYAHLSLSRATTQAVTSHLDEIDPSLPEARLRLVSAVDGIADREKARAAVAKQFTSILSSQTKSAVSAITASTSKSLRDALKDESAKGAVKELESAQREESGPSARQSSLTSQVLAQTVTLPSLGPFMAVLGSVIDRRVPYNGDEVTLDHSVRIPVSHGAFVGLRAVGKAWRDHDTTRAGLTFSFTGGWDAAIARAMAGLGGYLALASSRGGHGAMEMASYTLYRRFRESRVIPADLTSTLWGLGGITKGADEDHSAAKYREAESWASGIEQSMTEADSAESGLHAEASGRLGHASVAQVEGGVAVNTGTRYTKQTLERSGALTAPLASSGSGPQPLRGERVTTIEAFAGASGGGGVGTTEAYLTYSAPDASLHKPYRFSVQASAGAMLPGMPGQIVDWAVEGASKLTSAAITAVNKWQQGSKGGAALKGAEAAAKAGLEVIEFPVLKNALEESVGVAGLLGMPFVEGAESSTLASQPGIVSHAVAPAVGAVNREYTNKAVSLASTRLMSGSSPSSGLSFTLYIDFLAPKERSYFALARQTSTHHDLHVLETRIVSRSSLFYFDPKSGRLEAGGARLGGTR